MVGDFRLWKTRWKSATCLVTAPRQRQIRSSAVELSLRCPCLALPPCYRGSLPLCLHGECKEYTGCAGRADACNLAVCSLWFLHFQAERTLTDICCYKAELHQENMERRELKKQANTHRHTHTDIQTQTDRHTHTHRHTHIRMRARTHTRMHNNICCYKAELH